MDSKAAFRTRLENLSPEQRAALLQKIARLREQQNPPQLMVHDTGSPAGSRYPLSLAQRRLWMLSQLGSKASAAYNIASAFCFDKGLDPEQLQHAWRRLLARHDVLRSAFMQEGETLFQRPRAAADWSLQRYRLAPGRDAEAQLQKLASTEAATPFDLQHDWLLKVIYCDAATGSAGLVIVIHHIVCDGLSITGMIGELAQYYREGMDNADAVSADARPAGTLQQYRDYVEYEARADNSKAKAYWRDIFASPPETLDMLLDLPRPVSKDFSGSAVAMTLSKADASAFETLCHANNATLYMGLVALVQLLLARFANVSEVTLGTPVAGRPGAQFDTVVGPFVNTIALRQTIDHEQTFLQLLTDVRRRVLGGFQHQGLAFDELVTELGFAKDPSRSPLYDVMLGFTVAEDQALSFTDSEGGNNAGRALRIPLTFSKVDLTFHFEKGSDGNLHLDLEYATGVVLESTAKRFCEAWHLLIIALPEQPTIKLGELALQSEEQRRLLVEGVNATARTYPQQACLADLFRETVRNHPDAMAVHAGDVQLSYRDLDALSDKVAHRLLTHPVYQPGCRIALMLDKDERALIVILAIVKSRATYVPLAANTPLERVCEVLEAGEVRLLFAEAGRMAELQQHNVELIDADALLNAGDPAPGSIPRPDSGATTGNSAPAEHEPAYLMFTSGSTGKPKGTLIAQHSVLRLVCNTDFHQVRAHERVLLTGSLAFDAATFEIWGPLLNGGCVCIPAGTTLLEVHEFGALVEHYQIDTAFLTTGLFNQLVDNSASAFGQLQTVLTGGEKISVEHVRRLLQLQPELTLLHVYGPTENTTFSTWHRISREDLERATIPIGRPIANSRIYLLDQNLQPVPIGVPGEIYCGGDGIALGYLQHHDASTGGRSPVFVADPFSAADGDRLYRTGDLAKWNHRRELVFLGRNDRQVKVRGFRVELGEVEYHLRTLPEVFDAFVQARGAAGSSELVAWLVAPAAISATLTVSAVRDALKATVPNYMLPAKVVCLTRLPLNASGKVDVNALPLPEDDDAGSLPVGQLNGPAERELARLYASVLGLTGSAVQRIDREANFFSLGGDSIRAIQLVSLARSAGYRFTLKDIFASETLAGLAAVAAVTPQAAAETVLSCGPLSPTQHWWLEQSGMPADHFNLSSVFKVAAPIDMVALRAALDELLVLHPVLRLTLDVHAQQQAITDRGRYVLREHAAGQSRQQCWQQLQQAISLQDGILLAVGVATEADATWLAVVVHHIAADEVSGRLFAENLQRLYQRHLATQREDTTSVVPEPVQEALGLINWAAQLKAAVERGAMDHDLAYWQGVVARGRQTLLRQQGLFEQRAAPRGMAVRTLSGGETQLLLQLGAKWLRMKPQEILLAAFIAAWRHTLGDAGCVLSLEGHGREQIAGLDDCSSTMGWFTSLYPCVFNTAVGGTGAGTAAQEFDLYREVKDTLRRLPASGFTYLPLRYYKDPETQQSLALNPQLSFNYLGESISDPAAWLSAADEHAGDDHGETVSEPFKLDVLSRISEGQFELTLRGQAPQQTIDLPTLAGAWQSELATLTQCLQDFAANRLSGKTADVSLLSLCDSLVPFATLDELDATLAALRLPASSVEEILPLTGMQSGMWLHCATHPTAYQDQVALRLQQPLDEGQFRAAAHALVAETQALRTGFAQTANGELLQIVFRERAGNYQYLDRYPGTGSPADDSADDLARLRASLRDRPRDLLRDPLFSLTLVRLSEACFELIIDFHHMALDGWTSALLLQRLEQLYFGDASSGDSNAANGMRAYFEWLHQQPEAQAKTYWQTLLGDYQSRSDVPAHLPREPAAPPQPLFVETRTGAALHARLLAWCEQQGLTVNAAVQTLWGVFLARLTGSDDLVFGATVSGRDIDVAGVGNIAGMLINTLPVRIRVGEALSFAEQARETAQQFAESMSFGHLSLAELQTLTPARGGLVTHTLVFENYPAADAGATRWHWQPEEIYDPMHFEFGLIVAPLDDDLSFRFVADGSLYRQDRLENMAAELCALLDTLLEQPERSVLASAGAKGWSVSANFTADSLLGLLQYHEYISGRSGAVTLLPYDQSVQELINPQSRLRQMQAQQHIVLWRPMTDADGKVMQAAAFDQLAELASAQVTYARACKASHLYFVPCPWLDPGHPDSDQLIPDWALYREYVAFVKGAFASLPNAEVLSLEDLCADYKLSQPCYPPALVFGDIPYTEEFFAALANRLVRQRDLHSRQPVKVYVVDADDTLWGGIVGEDGAEGVRLDAAHICLQEKLVNAHAAGALVCLATKNNEADVRAVFDQREMPLQWRHLTRVCASWGPKSESILTLATDLSLGLDSFVFIDDSPMECEQVRSACPGVLAIQLPVEQQREDFLRHFWLLDARAATREDAVRSQMYAEELQRSSARKSTGSYGEFLAALDIRIDMHRPQPGDLPRLAQLSQRTNQFNTTGIRYSEAELDALLREPETDMLCVRVTDKYGDYGLAGSVFVRHDAKAWIVFGMMLSCRVLGRGVEHSIVRHLAQEAAAGGADALRVDFVKLARNAPALQFLHSVASTDVPSPAATKAGAAWQFLLPVSEAAYWQPGAEAATELPDDAGSDMVSGSTALPTGSSARQVAVRTSHYYGYLASTLNSGTAILHALQHQQVIRKTGRATHSAGTRTPPVTPTELMLASYFAELLGQAEIFCEDSFHDLGGHSLKAMMLFSRIAARYGLALDFRDLQAHPTLAELAVRIDTMTPVAESPGISELTLKAVPEADSYPVSPGQSRLWMVEKIRGAGPSPFHMHATLTLSGSINRQALNLALERLCQRHEALRTCFRENAGGEVRQVVVAASALPGAAPNAHLHWFDGMLADGDLDTMAREQSGQAFDLSEAPLVRIAAGELASGRSVIFITMHHIISDGWSMGVFSRELSQFYRAYDQGRQPETELRQEQVEALQFRDFACWQQNWLASVPGERAVRFWREHFAEPVEALQLPAAAPRPTLKQSEGDSVHIDIEAGVWTDFRALLAELGISDFSGLFAVLQLVLARLSGQQDFCIGTAVAGRQHQQLESVIGFFVNLLPIRATLDLDYQIDVYLRAVAAEVNDCLSHQNVPFDAIVSSLDLPRDPGRSPLFDVLLVLQNTELDNPSFGDQVAEVHPVASTTSQYDLTLSAFPAVDGTLRLVADYDSVIYSAANIELILRCCGRAMRGLMETGSSVVGATVSQQESLAGVPWLDESDLACIETFEGLPQDSVPELLPDIFMRAAAGASGTISDSEHDWSYEELAADMQRISAQLATSLTGQAAGKQQPHVGVVGKRSVRSIAAMLGIMDAGAVYIPLDLDNPVERLSAIVDEGAVDLLLSTDAEGAELAVTLQHRHPQTQHLCYVDIMAAARDPAHLRRVKCSPDDVAYMIFTSGSTGKPKGVQVSHAAFAAMIRQQIPAFGVRPEDVCGQFAALSFDASLSEIFLALGTGASLAIAPHEARTDIDIFMRWLRTNAVTVITLPPVFLRALDKRPLADLRVLVTAGEAAIGADMRHYSASLRVLNAYGPTETSVCASVYRVRADHEWPFSVPIGRPLPGVLLTVRDRVGARVPVGTTGELYIGGSTLAAGYYAAPELSAEKFGVIPGDSAQQGHWYRSGDLVRWREDGLLEFLGRADAQIKMRGYRIEPGEIEHAARNVEGIRDAVALVHPQLGLLLFCLSQSGSKADDTDFRFKVQSELGRTLPRYMMPGDVVLLKTFPLSPAGKIDHAALLALAASRESGFVAPETESENKLAQAWQRVLKAGSIGRHDDFFALGGDSIKALEVITMLRMAGLSCELKDFFAVPRLSDMAGALVPWQVTDAHRESLVGQVDLLPIQRWFLSSRDAAIAGHFNIVAELEMPVSVSETLLRDVLDTLIQNHDSLRARFYRQDGSWHQHIQETLDTGTVLSTYRRAAGVAAQADQLALEELACRPFALATDPLFRCILVQSQDGGSQSLVLSMHHLIADWVSLRILIADLNALVQALMNERSTTSPPLLPPAPPHLLRLLARERIAELSSQQPAAVPAGVSEQAMAEYHQAVATMDALALDCGTHSDMDTLHLQVAADDLARLKSSLRRSSEIHSIELRLQDLLLATVLSELRDLLPTKDIPVLAESHGRDGTLDLSRQVGWLTRARLLTVEPDRFTGPGALMQAHRALRAAVMQPDVFACMASASAFRDALPALVSFNYLGEFANSQSRDDLFRLTGRVFEKAVAPDSPVDVPLHLEFYVVDNTLELQVAWSPAVFESGAMRACWERVRRRFAGV